MTNVGQTTRRWAAIAAFAAPCVLALSACEENAVPNSEPAAAAPPQASAELMGAPDGASTRTTPYVAPPSGANAVPPASEGPPSYPPPPPYAYAPRPSAAPSEVIAMAPIPNPPEEPRHTHHWRPYHRVHHRYGWWGPVFSGRPAPMRHNHHHAWMSRATAASTPAKPLHPVRHAATTGAGAAAGAHVTGPHTAPAPHPDKSAVTAASGGSSTAAPPTAASAAPPTAGARYDALTTALATVFGHEASLIAPANMPTDTASDVSLTVPGDFAQTLATEAGKQNMLNEAASANLEATLVGDGYTITPVESQAQALMPGEPSVFHWKVTPQGAVQGPLHADARLTLIASGRSLALGSIKGAGAAKNVGRIVGIGLLVLIALVLIGWVVRSRRPAATGAVRPRPQNRPPAGI